MESSLFSEVRLEYKKQMASKLVPPLLEYFRHLRSEVYAESHYSVLPRFQKRCADIPKWNQDVVIEETNKLIDASKCDYLEELMTALFVAHTKVMAAVRVNKSKKHKKLTITVPKLDHYLHRVFTECAKSFWKAPFIFQEDLSPIDRQKNLLQAEIMIEEAIYSAVRDLLPVKKILQEYIAETEDDDEEQVVEQKGGSEQPWVEPEPEPVPVLAPVPELEPVLTPVAVPEPVLAPLPEPVLTPVEEQSVGKVQVIKEDTEPAVPENIKIDTEPSVRFSETVSVFDERKPHVSEMRSIENPLDRSEDDEAVNDESLQVGDELGDIEDAEELEEMDDETMLDGVETLE